MMKTSFVYNKEQCTFAPSNAKVRYFYGSSKLQSSPQRIRRRMGL